jgi:hypothetical protein
MGDWYNVLTSIVEYIFVAIIIVDIVVIVKDKKAKSSKIV